MTRQAALWSMAGIFAALALVAAIAERRRAGRRDLDRVGWVPWALVQIGAIIAAAAAAAIALHS